MTSDIQKLRKLAQAALVAPDGLSAEWMDRLGQFQEYVSPAAIIELLDRLEAAESAWKEADKACRDLTEKVIPNIREQLESAEKERDALRTKIAAMEKQTPVGRLLDRLEAAEKERDILRDTLEQVFGSGLLSGSYTLHERMRNIVSNALSEKAQEVQKQLAAQPAPARKEKRND